MFESLKTKHSVYARELGYIESQIEEKRITNLGHHLNKRKIELGAMIGLIEELLNECVNKIKQ